MAWLSRNTFNPSDKTHADDLNNLANDVRQWGGDVNGGGHHLYNVILNGGSGGGGAVTSVFGRQGDVVAQAGDYSAAQVTNAVSTLGSYADPAWITSLAWSKIGGAPATGVSSVFGRSGAVVPQAGDYTAAQVGAPPVARQIIAGTGLSGGGDLSADRTLSVVPDTTLQRLGIQSGAAPVATRANLNFIQGANVTLTVADNAANNRVDVTVAALSSTAPVASVFGRLGAVVATAGDYSASQVTNAVDSSLSYPNPTWISSLAWAKLTGVPTILTDPTTTRGDILVRSASALVRHGVGSDGQVLTADSTQADGVRWAAAATGGMTDPTTTLGDLIVRGSSGTTRLPVGGTNGQVLTVDSAQTLGVKWAAVVGGVSSVFTRTGAVVAQVGDYTAAQVTNAVSTLGSYADPAWITSLSWSKVSGAPSVGSYQTPWLQNINGGNFQLANVSKIGIGTSSPGSLLTLYQSVAGGMGPVLELRNAGGQAGDAAAIRVFNWDNYPRGELQMSVQGPTYGTDFVFLTGGGQAAATEIMRLTNNGKLGISTATPTALLSLGTGTANVKLAVYDSGSDKLGIGVQPSTLTYDSGVGSIHAFYTQSGVERMRISAAGLVGIGNAAPIAMLTVGALTGVSNGELVLARSNSGPNRCFKMGLDASYNLSIGDFGYSGGNTYVPFVTVGYSNGYVGIGKTPSYPLDVNGVVGFLSQIIGNGKEVAQTGDTYLRINQSNQFSSGCFFGASDLKMVGGHLLLGTNGTQVGEVDISGTAGDVTNRITINGNASATNFFNTGGNFGHNTATPGATLEVYSGNITNALRLNRYTSGVYYTDLAHTWTSAAGDGFSIQVGNGGALSEVARFTCTGLVGINSPNPQATLDIKYTANQGAAGLNNHIVLREASNNQAYGLALGYIVASEWCGSLQAYANNAATPLLLNPVGGPVIVGRYTRDGSTAALQVTGGLNINGLDANSIANLRMAYGNYGCIMRNDGATWYFMVTASGSPMSGWASPFPISIDLASKCVGIRVGASASYGLSVDSINAQGIYVNGVAIAAGGQPQTPWVQQINANSQTLININVIQGLTSGTQSQLVYWQGIGIGGYVQAGYFFYAPTQDNAMKASTNYWAVYSDMLLKKDVREFTDGLSVVRQIKPIRFRYNGKLRTNPDLECIGINAEEHRDILPDGIASHKADLDGDGVERDVLTFNPHSLFFCMVNAIKELADRLEKLEARA